MHRHQDYLLTMLRAAMPKAGKRPFMEAVGSDTELGPAPSTKRSETAAVDGERGNINGAGSCLWLMSTAAFSNLRAF